MSIGDMIGALTAAEMTTMAMYGLVAALLVGCRYLMPALVLPMSKALVSAEPHPAARATAGCRIAR